MNQQPKKLSPQACLTVAGVALQMLGNVCFAIVTVHAVKNLREKFHHRQQEN